MKLLLLFYCKIADIVDTEHTSFYTVSKMLKELLFSVEKLFSVEEPGMAFKIGFPFDLLSNLKIIRKQ